MTDRSPQPGPFGSYWVDGILDHPSGDPKMDALQQDAAYRAERSMADIENRLRKASSGGFAPSDLRGLAASLLAIASLKLHREFNPVAHECLMSHCVGAHPDLEKVREGLRQREERILQESIAKDEEIRRLQSRVTFLARGILLLCVVLAIILI